MKILCLSVFLKVAFIGSIGAGAERLVEESERAQEKGQKQLQGSNQVQERRPEELQERKQVQDERQEEQQSIQVQGELQERRLEQEQGLHLEQKSNVVMAGKVETTDKKGGNGCTEKVSMAYQGAVGGHQKVQNEADQCRESEPKLYNLRSKEKISEASSSDNEKEQEDNYEREIGRQDETIKDEKGNNGENDEKLRESFGEEDIGRPDHLLQSIASKETKINDEDEDIMREIEEQLKDISVVRM